MRGTTSGDGLLNGWESAEVNVSIANTDPHAEASSTPPDTDMTAGVSFG
jgi:hypothetical protein